MNETLTVPIGEQEHLKEFFRALNENGQKQEAADFSSLVAQLGQMEKQYAAVLSELKTVQGQLDRIQDKGIRAAVKKSVAAIQSKVEQAKDQFRNIRIKSLDAKTQNGK